MSLLGAIWLAFAPPRLVPPARSPGRLVSLAELRERNPGSVVVVFPECTTTNGRAILPLSPSLLSAAPDTHIYPVSLRYSPSDVTTPVPHAYAAWVWKLCAAPTHCMRVRIAEPVYNSPSLASPVSSPPPSPSRPRGRNGSGVRAGSGHVHARPPADASDGSDSESSDDAPDNVAGKVSKDERRVLDRVAEDLARLGRVKRVGLSVHDKVGFVKLWTKRRR